VNILVCIKPTPSHVEREKSTGFSLNTYDEASLENALLLKDKVPGSSVTVLCMHNASTKAKRLISDTFKVGTDRAIILSDSAFKGSDTLATSYVLASAVKKLGEFDLILCGKQSTDSNTSQVGAGLAEMLNIPHSTCISEICKLEDNYIKANKVLESGVDELIIKLPALLTIERGISLRYRNVDMIKAARSKTLEVWSFVDIDVDESLCGLGGSPTSVLNAGKPNEDEPKTTEFIEGNTQEIAAILVKKIHDFLLN